MDEQERQYAELSDMVDNFFLRGRQIRSMENKPRYYGSDVLLYPNEVYTLKAIARQEGINQKDLSEQMFRTKGATSMVVRKLKEKGLVVQRESETDQRICKLYTTEKGRHVYQTHLEYDKRYVKHLAESLDVALEDLVTMNRILRMLNDRFNRRYQERGEAAFLENSEEL